MRDLLLFTLDDLGDRQIYVLAIFAIVILAIGGVLLRDAFLAFERLGMAPPEADDALIDEGAVAPHPTAASRRATFGRRRHSA